MSGTKVGGQKTAQTNKERRGSDYYERIGAMGGKKGVGPDYQKGGSKASGFAANPERASYYGAYGGRKSRKRKYEVDSGSYYQTLLAKQRVMID